MWQSILSVTFHINCIVARCLINGCLSRHVPLSGHNDVALLNDVTNDVESTRKIENYVTIASSERETISKLINRIPGLRLYIKFTRLSFENAC